MKQICVTDSGLGGLSVCAYLVKQLKKQDKGASIIYFNACYADDYGYNAIAGREEKIEMFDRALYGIEKFCEPDEILVACNTLSVLLSDTTFVKKRLTAVKSIVDSGIELIQRTLSPKEMITVFGTETTIIENTYKNRLTSIGWPENHIRQIACPGLQTAISSQNQVGKKIAAFTGQANKNSWYLLACTHFGIRSDAFGHSKILDPNLSMAHTACEQINESGPIRMKMVSRYPILKQEMSTWSNLLKEPLTIEMLRNCDVKEDLF